MVKEKVSHIRPASCCHQQTKVCRDTRTPATLLNRRGSCTSTKHLRRGRSSSSGFVHPFLFHVLWQTGALSAGRVQPVIHWILPLSSWNMSRKEQPLMESVLIQCIQVVYWTLTWPAAAAPGHSPDLSLDRKWSVHIMWKQHQLVQSVTHRWASVQRKPDVWGRRKVHC